MILTIGMIVKNEEANLEKCLEALKPLRENLETELIIVDTGSTDKTVEIAEKNADKVLHFEWINDFSAARNVALREAKGEWYMTIDADEELIDYQPLKDFLFGNPLRDNYAMASIIQRNFRDDGSYSDFNAVRLAKVTPTLCYEGKIHEAFNTRGSLFMTNAAVNHSGYAESNNKSGERYERNITLLTEELEKKPNSPLIMKQLYDSYVPFDKAEAIKWLEKCRVTAIAQKDDKLILAAFAKECVHYAVEENVSKIINLYEEYKKQSLLLTKKNGHYALEMDIFATAGLCFRALKKDAEAEKCFSAYVEITEAYEEGKMNTAELFIEEPTFPKSSDNYVNILRKYRETLQSLGKQDEAAIIAKRIINPKWDGSTVVTIGLIVKNEEKVLERCLQGIQPIRDMVKTELIVVDTGSTDKTVEIAEKYGAKMLYFEWIGDFSAARNVGLRAAKGEWFMFIDADEHLVNGEKIGKFFADVNFNKDFDAASYIIRNLDGDRLMNDFRGMRIARIFKGLKFHRKIHEQYDAPFRRTAMIEAYAEHRSYGRAINEENDKERFKRNVALIQKELDENPDNTLALRQMYDSYSAIDPDKALGYLIECYEKSVEKKANVMIIISVAGLMMHYQLTGNNEKAIELFENYKKMKIVDIPRKYGHFTTDIDIYATAAIAYANLQRAEESAAAFKEWVMMTDKFVSADFTTVDTIGHPVRCYKDATNYTALLEIYTKVLRALDRTKEAEKIYRRIKLHNNPEWDETLLTIGMIVKNEEKDLEKCLKSLDHLRHIIKCELIIVDTGSIDNTVSIAEKYADEVRYFKWINDFSAARNESMRDAKGDWFMFIDADEWFESTKEIEKFFRDGEYINFKFATYIQRNYMADGQYSDFYAPRMAKILPEQCFRKKVHESLTLIEPVKYFRDYVHHYGYMGETSQKKVLRNMEMLLEEIKERPEDVIVLEQLATAYAYRDNDKMVQCLQDGVRISKKYNHVPMELIFYARLMRFYVVDGQFEKAYELGTEIVPERLEAEALSPSDMDILGFFGMACHRLGKFDEAETPFKRFMAYYSAYKKGKFDGPMLMVHTPDTTQPAIYARVLLDYADTLVSLEKWEEAYNVSLLGTTADEQSSFKNSTYIYQLVIVQRLLVMRKLGRYQTLPDLVRKFSAESMPDETRRYLIGALKNEIKQTEQKDTYLKLLREICREGFKYNLPYDFCALISLIGTESKIGVTEAAFIKAMSLVKEITDTGAELTQIVMRNNLSFDLISNLIDPESAEHLYINLYVYEETFADDFCLYISENGTDNINARSKLILIKMAEASLKKYSEDTLLTNSDEVFRQCLVILTDSYLKEVFSPDVITTENAEHMQSSVRAAYFILIGYLSLENKDYKEYIKTLRGVIAAEPNLKNYVSALTQKVRTMY
jgi:glycosyltransferase involved in cell wall biosynthesis